MKSLEVWSDDGLGETDSRCYSVWGFEVANLTVLAIPSERDYVGRAAGGYVVMSSVSGHQFQ